MYLTPEAEHQLTLLRDSIGKIEKSIAVYEEGVIEESKDIDLVQSYLSSLNQALEHIKKSNAIVSMMEYALMKIDLVKASELMHKKRIALQTLQSTVSLKRKEIDTIMQTMANVIHESTRGQVLSFSKKEPDEAR